MNRLLHCDVCLGTTCVEYSAFDSSVNIPVIDLACRSLAYLFAPLGTPEILAEALLLVCTKQLLMTWTSSSAGVAMSLL